MAKRKRDILTGQSALAEKNAKMVIGAIGGPIDLLLPSCPEADG